MREAAGGEGEAGGGGRDDQPEEKRKKLREGRGETEKRETHTK